VAVAYSGGRDSTALLFATLRVARSLGLVVHALHVHHGLSPQADAWLVHGRELCERWAAQGWPVIFRSRRVCVESRGRGIEAAAREARYAALQAMAGDAGCDIVLLAHHREDQAETVLLQALRGAGMAGLAAMPRQIRRAGLMWARPWLSQPREAVQAYVDEHGLSHVEDDSNADPRHARNRLRLNLWPELVRGYDGAADALGAVARHAQEARACLQDLADLDLRAALVDEGLRLAGLAALSEARRANAVRHWLAGQLRRPVAASLVERVVHESGAPGSRVWPVDEACELGLYRGVLQVVSRAAAPSAAAGAGVGLPEVELGISSPGVHALPGWGGELVVEPAPAGQGAAVDLAQLACLSLRARSGGEQFQLAANRPPRSLKKQFQALGVPAWSRDGPLLWAAGRLLFVPGLGIDAAWHEPAAAAPCTLVWRPVRGGPEGAARRSAARAGDAPDGEADGAPAAS
jgi:tRNA(Ile)-lysidine synthase